MDYHSFCLIFDILENKSLTLLLNGVQWCLFKDWTKIASGLLLCVKCYMTISTENA